MSMMAMNNIDKMPLNVLGNK